MNKEKITPLVITTLLLISTLLVVSYKPIVSGNSAPQHTATLSPSITTVPEVTYTFNVTCNSESVNRTNIILPPGFTNISAEALNDTGDWEFSWVSGTNSYNFSIAAGSPTPNLEANHWTRFRVTVQWPAVPPTTARFGVDAFSQATASANNTVWLTVTFNPQFSATITPSLVKSSRSYNFNVTVVNLASSAGLGTVNVTYPVGWTFNAIVNYGGSRSWSIVHDASARTFKLSGPNLLANEYFWIQVNMTTQSSGADPVNWNALAWDISGTFLGTRSLSVTVDGQNPTVTINQPGSGVNYYSVGSGKRIWINGTVSDDLNITKYGVTLTINDTRFERLVYAKGANHLTYNFAFANKTVIQDGKLTVKVTATDASGRVGSAERSTTIDNSAPQMVYVKALDQSDEELPYVSGVYWMGANTTEIKVKAAFYNPAEPINGRIYLNSTYEAFTNETATSGFNVTGSNYVVLKITLVDSATPTRNNFTRTWEIKRDRVKPSAPTFTVQPICGGAIIRGLTATDNVGVLSFKVYINGTPVTVPLTSLQAQTLTIVGSHRTFSGILVLNLASYAGETANITIAAVDYGANEGTGVSTLISVPKGTWYPIVLRQKWNLVSLPLIPNNTATSNIYSLILKQGAAGVTVTYGFDNTAKSWVMNPTTMTDGKGYWIYMKAYDVLIVQGLPTPEPPALPTTYHLPAGWCLVGFTETVDMHAHDYVESLEPGSYFRWLYVWDAATQSWTMVDTKEGSSDMLYPGQAFWIYLYTDQDLIPPIP